MTPTIIELTGTQVFKIKHLESGLAYGKDTKLAGKTYSRFRYQGIVFTVSDSDTFVKDFLAGKCYSIDLIEATRPVTDAEGTELQVRDIQFDSHVSSSQIIGVTTTQAIITGLTEGTISAKDAMSMADLEEMA
jgi:hypothetical protein